MHVITIPQRDGQTDRQTDRQTSETTCRSNTGVTLACHKIVSIHLDKAVDESVDLEVVVVFAERIQLFLCHLQRERERVSK